MLSQLTKLKQELLSNKIISKNDILDYEALSFNQIICLRNKILNEIDPQQLSQLDKAIETL